MERPHPFRDAPFLGNPDPPGFADELSSSSSANSNCGDISRANFVLQ